MTSTLTWEGEEGGGRLEGWVRQKCDVIGCRMGGGLVSILVSNLYFFLIKEN